MVIDKVPTSYDSTSVPKTELVAQESARNTKDIMSLSETLIYMQQIKQELVAQMDQNADVMHFSEGPKPKAILAQATEQYRVGVLREKAISQLAALQVDFGDEKDQAIFEQFKQHQAAKLTTAQTVTDLYAAITSIEQDLQRIDRENKIIVGEQTEKIGKSIAIPASLTMERYQTIPPEKLFYTFKVDNQPDARAAELKTNVETAGSDFQTKTDTYNTAANELANAQQKLKNLEVQLIDLQKNLTIALEKLDAGKANTVVGDDKLVKLGGDKTTLENEIKTQEAAIEEQKQLITTQKLTVQSLSTELTVSVKNFVDQIDVLITHQLSKQQELLKILTGSIETQGKKVVDEVNKVSQEWQKIDNAIIAKQTEYANMRFSIADTDFTSEQLQKLTTLQQEIITEKTQFAKKVDEWIAIYAQQGINIQSLYSVNEEVARIIATNLGDNIAQINNQINTLDITLKGLENELKKVDADITLFSNTGNTEKLTPVLAYREELTAQTEEITKTREGLMVKKNDLVTKQNEYSDIQKAARNSTEYTKKVAEQRVINFAQQRTNNTLRQEKAYLKTLNTQQANNTTKITELEKEKNAFLAQQTEQKKKFDTAKAVFDQNRNDASANKKFSEVSTSLTELNKKLEANAKVLEVYRDLNKQIETEQGKTQMRIDTCVDEITDLGKQQRDIEVQLVTLQPDTQAKNAPFTEVDDYTTHHMTGTTPFASTKH